MTEKPAPDVVEAVAEAIMSYLFGACQPNRGDVFSWCDDHSTEIAKAALQARPDAALVGELERHIEALDRHGLCAGTANFLRNRILSALRTHDDTLEDAAKVAEGEQVSSPGDNLLKGYDAGAVWGFNAGCRASADAIRTLKGKAKP